MPLTGNHETYTPVWGERSMPRLFVAQFKLPDNGPEGLKGQVYSFDYGNAHFVMLDSQEREEARFAPDMLEKQKAWLTKDLAATDKAWKIVFFHKPPYRSKSARGDDNIRAALVPIFDQYHVDVVFNGHEHVYARTYPLCGDAVVDSPDKGTIYVTTGRSGTDVHKNLLAGDWHEFFYNPADEPNYLTVEIRGDRLTARAFRQNGSLIDSWAIDKTR
jgi:acid phosphatase type 7